MKPKPEGRRPLLMGVLWGGVAALLLSLPARAETAGVEKRACCSHSTSANSASPAAIKPKPIPKVTRRYACDLRSVFSQCRQYTFEEGASDNIARMASGCAAMGGHFGKLTCPSRGVSGVCRDVVLDYRKPDIAYDNYYYQDASQRWTTSSIQHACTTLEGEYSKQ